MRSCLSMRCETAAVIVAVLFLVCFGCSVAVSDQGTTQPASSSNFTTTTPTVPSHKPLAPVDGSDIGLFVVVAVALFVASGAGVGGGVLVVPALLIIGRFNAIAAVALSNVTILASSVANMMFNIPRRNMQHAGPLIDWDLVLLFGPPTVVGSIAGSYINMVIPTWVTKTTLFLLLVPMAWRMVDKANALYKRETAARRKAAAGEPVLSFKAEKLAQSGTAATETAVPHCQQEKAGQGDMPEATVMVDGQAMPASAPAAAAAEAVILSSSNASAAAAVSNLPGPSQAKDLEAGQTSCHTIAAEASSQSASPANAFGEAASIGNKPKVPFWQPCKKVNCSSTPAVCQTMHTRLQKEQAWLLPPLQVGLLVLTLVFVAATSLIAGFLLECGSWRYWLLALSPLVVMLLVWAVARHHVVWKAEWKTRLGMQEVGDLKWDRRTTTVYPAICISAGIIAGMLGLGGGLVLTPLMLELGVHPAVSAASTQVTLLISSSTSAIVYAVNGAVPWDYGIVLVIIGFVATLLGQWLVSWLVRRLGRPSILVITLAVMFTTATCAALAVVIMTIIELAQHPEKLSAHKGVCPAR